MKTFQYFSRLGHTTLFLTALLFPFAPASLPAAPEAPLLAQQEVEPYGLTRTWFNQIEIDPVRNKVLHVIVEGGTMFLVSDDAKLHAVDAETGRSLWMRSLGQRDMLFQEPAANSRMVAVLNGLELFVFDRRHGKLLMNAPLPGAASTGCEMSENYVYIPMMGGRIIAFPLEDNITKMEEEGAAAATAAAEESGTGQITESKPAVEGEDPVLADIAKRFAETKESILAEMPPPREESDIVLRGAIGIPMVCQSFGNLMVKPLLSSQILVYNQRGRVRQHRETLTWVTDRGFLFGAGINSLSQEHFELQYMVDSSAQSYYLGADRIARREWTENKEIVVRPTPNQCVPYVYVDNKPQAARIPSMVVVGSKGAYVFAVRDRIGEVVWQFASNGAVLERIAVVGTDVYCPTGSGGLHALDLTTGKEKWYTSGIHRFVAASQNRLYTIDRRTRFMILDRRTGSPINSFDARRFDRFLFNIETDHIYVINDTGLVQCLRERQPQARDGVADDRTMPVVRHRLTCKQYADALRGREIPELYWMKSLDDGGN